MRFKHFISIVLVAMFFFGALAGYTFGSINTTEKYEDELKILEHKLNVTNSQLDILQTEYDSMKEALSGMEDELYSYKNFSVLLIKLIASNEEASRDYIMAMQIFNDGYANLDSDNYDEAISDFAKAKNVFKSSIEELRNSKEILINSLEYVKDSKQKIFILRYLKATGLMIDIAELMYNASKQMHRISLEYSMGNYDVEELINDYNYIVEQANKKTDELTEVLYEIIDIAKNL